jgi:AcrR family transcriptional regulator
VIASSQDRILDAAAEVMSRHGLAGSTTREIAQVAGCSEALLYKHFADKEEIFLAVLSERLPQLIVLLKELPARAGERTVAAQLTEVVEQAVPFFAAGMPITSSLFARPDLAARHRDRLRARGAGPHRANGQVARYLRAEQELGRVAADADPDAIAALLLGACYQRAFLLQLLGAADLTPPADRFAPAVVAAVLRGVVPPP